MAIFIVNHKVNDFGIWKKAYDEHEPNRVTFGIKDHFVLQAVDDPNHVTVVGEGELEKIQQFFDSPELKGAMEAAGVASAPEIVVGENKR